MVVPESSADGSSADDERSPAWVDAVELVASVSNPVLDGLRRDLVDRRARWAVTVVRVAGISGTALLRRRYPKPVSADQRLVSATLRDARARGELDVAELRRDPAFRAAQARLNRHVAQMMIYAVGVIVAHRLLLAELKRRGVRRPHLVAGVAMATAQTTRRVGTLIAENRRRATGSP